MTERCRHEDFAAVVEVNRLEDVGAFAADIRIQCTQCGTPFQFIGVDMGIAPDRPMVSADLCELHAPIAPPGEPVGRYTGFYVARPPND